MTHALQQWLSVPCPFSWVFGLVNSMLTSADHIFSSAVSPGVDKTIQLFRYIPYFVLTLRAHIASSNSDEEYIVNAHGGLSAKGLDRCSKKNIGMVEWSAASMAVERLTQNYHGEARGDALVAHHQIVSGLAL
ncbi:hypothetical protein AcV5_003456 [Taiwanofungus camphoratus]|nr:hypothetical protein AcV5_003456 [Antrodia cinnamomea]